MSRADKRAHYRDSLCEVTQAQAGSAHLVMLAFALCGGNFADYRRGMAMCALLGFSTCTGKELLP